MRCRRPRRSGCGLALALALVVGAPAHADDEVPFDERGKNVFFEEPDRESAARIAELISRFSSGSVSDRILSRRALEDIGHWSVVPLIEALADMEPPVRSAAALTLAAIRDVRSIEPMRTAVVRETSHPYVAAFAALGLGRFEDEHAVEPLRVALRSPKSLHILRAASPLALARIRTPEAQTLLVERFRSGEGNANVRSARLLALGFFPAAALRADRPEPSALLSAGLSEGRRSVRRAAIIAFLVASLRRSDTRDFILGFIDKEKKPEVRIAALVGLSRYEDADTTALLSRIAARSGDESVRIVAADLLVARRDPVALSDLLSLLRKPAPARLKAAAIVALAGIDHPDAVDAVLDRLNDRSDLVRAAAGVATVQFDDPDSRIEAMRRIDARLKHGEPHKIVRHDLQTARAVLAGDEPSPTWREVGRVPVFSQLFRTHDERMLLLVNLAAEEALELRKITNLQTDAEILAGSGPPDGGGESGDGEGEGGGDGEGGEGGDGDSPLADVDRGNAPTVGSPRTAAWQELRDLKVELRREPYFSASDLATR